MNSISNLKLHFYTVYIMRKLLPFLGCLRKGTVFINDRFYYFCFSTLSVDVFAFIKFMGELKIKQFFWLWILKSCTVVRWACNWTHESAVRVRYGGIATMAHLHKRHLPLSSDVWFKAQLMRLSIFFKTLNLKWFIINQIIFCYLHKTNEI